MVCNNNAHMISSSTSNPFRRSTPALFNPRGEFCDRSKKTVFVCLFVCLLYLLIVRSNQASLLPKVSMYEAHTHHRSTTRASKQKSKRPVHRACYSDFVNILLLHLSSAASHVLPSDSSSPWMGGPHNSVYPEHPLRPEHRHRHRYTHRGDMSCCVFWIERLRSCLVKSHLRAVVEKKSRFG